MAYLMLVAAIGLEVAGTSMLPATHGFTRALPSVMCLSTYALVFLLLARIVERLPVGVVYATWSGMGVAAIMLIGVAFLGEPLNPMKVLGASLIVGGVVILNVTGVH